VHFRLHGGHEQALASVLSGEADLLGGFAVSADPTTDCDVGDSLYRNLYTHEEEGLLLAPADGEHAVGGDGFK